MTLSDIRIHMKKIIIFPYCTKTELFIKKKVIFLAIERSRIPQYKDHRYYIIMSCFKTRSRVNN